jgi:hypothetical protein
MSGYGDIRNFLKHALYAEQQHGINQNEQTDADIKMVAQIQYGLND